MNIDLTGKVALVTGGSRGVGRATSLALAESGADVIVNFVSSRKAAEEVAAQIVAMGRRCWIVKADVSEKDDVDEMFDFVKREIGSLDILVSNAATGGFRNIMDASRNNFRSAFETNVLALVWLVQAAAPLLEKSSGRAKIVTITSHGVTHAIPNYGLIGASKAALESLVRHLTLELGDRNININVVRAGLIRTDSTERLPGSKELFDMQVEYTQVGNRVLQPEDVANAILFLSSPLSDMVQGATLVVDGGGGFRGA
ncbi:MAG: SDR family oxidoreductase [Thermoguttaceae bacterium]|nr:SDR family oxidoreductase [Thermoguttaceae bacterium]